MGIKNGAIDSFSVQSKTFSKLKAQVQIKCLNVQKRLKLYCKEKKLEI